MAPSTSKKRGDDKKRKRGSDKGAKRFPSRLGAYAACRKLLGQIEGCRLPARDEDGESNVLEQQAGRGRAGSSSGERAGEAMVCRESKAHGRRADPCFYRSPRKY